MTDVEPLTSEDVFVAEASPDIALRDTLERTRPALGEDAEASLPRGAARPLTRREREAAANDPGIPRRVYAPASLRVPKQPLPADERFFRPGAAANRPPVRQPARTLAVPSPLMGTVHVSCELVQTPA